MNRFSPDSPTSNLISTDDDTGGNSQFQITSILQPNTDYILVFTTYSQDAIGNYVLLASGMTRVNLEIIQNITTTAPVTPTTRISTVTPTTRE